MSKKPIDYAIQACETMMRKFPDAGQLPPTERFHYHQGVFLSGVQKTYELTGDKRFLEYSKRYIDTYVDDLGYISYNHPAEMDDIQPGILMYLLYDETKDERYRNALGILAREIMQMPKNPDGGFWHKGHCVHQMWLDGLYMGGPIIAEYGARFNKPECIDEVCKQILLMERHTKDPETGLFFHAYDDSREAEWADPETGLSHEFWGRSIGWMPVAVMDDLDFIPEDHLLRKEVVRMVTELLENVCKYQDPVDGRWYQVVNKGDQPDNWHENSCSALFSAALFKAVRKGILPEKYLENAWKAYEGVIASLEFDGEDLLFGHVCIGTGVGDYTHYINRPCSTNDLHGMGAFLLMCAEAAKAE